MKSILFYDKASPKPYGTYSLAREPMGGTEATVIRIASALNDEGHPISINPHLVGADVIITLRLPSEYIEAKKAYPRAKHILWLHDYISGPYLQQLIDMINTTKDVEVVLVSQFHKLNFIDRVRNYADLTKVKIHVIHNPVVVDGVTPKPTDVNKLVFFSSPHKGLDYALHLFKMIRRLDPKMYLVLANPGYIPDHNELPEGVTNLGSLTHKELMEQVSNSLATFYPNRVFPETFGLVMAESNALGVPVLAHPLGAANEVLTNPKQLMDVREYKAVVDRILAWKAGDRPTVKADPRFELSVVIKQWEKIL